MTINSTSLTSSSDSISYEDKPLTTTRRSPLNPTQEQHKAGDIKNNLTVSQRKKIENNSKIIFDSLKT